MGLIEAAHHGQGDLPAWCERLLDAAGRVFTSPALNLGIGVRGEQGYTLVAAAARQPEIIRHLGTLVQRLAPEKFDPFWRFPRFVGFSTEVQGAAPEPELVAFQSMLSVSAILGMVALAGDHSMSIGVPLEGAPRLSGRERWLLTQVALHLEAGLRLRVLPGAEVARVRLDGRFLDIVEPVVKGDAWRERLGRHVVTVEHGRTRARRARFEAIDAWTALASGRWVLVEREERGVGRYYSFVETGRAHSLRALGEIEMRVAELSARGLSGKAVSYALGVAPATVSKHLASAAIKLGFSNRTHLVQGVSVLVGGAAELVAQASLTPAERDVLELVRRGWTNARIASERQRSERTVANQVSGLLQKLRAPSRRALASMALKARP